MKQWVFVALLALAATAAQAQDRRPDSRTLTCGQAKRLVTASGAVVMTTAPGVYDRYVRDGSFCATSLTTYPAWVPTTDRQECFIGYRCVPQDENFEPPSR